MNQKSSKRRNKTVKRVCLMRVNLCSDWITKFIQISVPNSAPPSEATQWIPWMMFFTNETNQENLAKNYVFQMCTNQSDHYPCSNISAYFSHYSNPFWLSDIIYRVFDPGTMDPFEHDKACCLNKYWKNVKKTKKFSWHSSSKFCEFDDTITHTESV